MIKKGMAIALLIAIVFWSFSALIPSEISSIDVPETQFSSHRALIHLKAISKAPHYLGSEEHDRVRDYIMNQLQDLGLTTQIQEGWSLDASGNLAKPRNIVARLKGSDGGKALLLSTHYDTDPSSAIGASDAGSGIVTILEGLRAFLSSGIKPKNDIIVLITDAEELGLNGAHLFVNQHEWAKDVQMVLNLEARGSGGPGIMFIETNQGNAKLIQGFKAAEPAYPLGNSLFYSIYKILPNDTDLTVFREQADISGFNFAFIDDHFDYHTELDNYDRLDRSSLEHQGTYMMAMLNYFTQANLEDLESPDDEVYFNMPIFNTMVVYPFSWIVPMLILAIFAFIWVLRYGFRNKVLHLKAIGKGALSFFIALILAGLLGYFAWPALKLVYPQYNEILQGFTYNGHDYIAAFMALTVAICCFAYHGTYSKVSSGNLLVIPIAVWLLLCTGLAVKLKGASFFIIPVYFAILSLFVVIRQKAPDIFLLVLLGVPLLTIIGPFVQMFPVGLGLKMLISSTLFVVLMFSLLIAVFGTFKHKRRWGYLFVLLAGYFIISAHGHSDFSSERPKPNSLLYVFDADDSTAVWATYDKILDGFTTPFLGENPNDKSSLNRYVIDSKYHTGFTFTRKAPIQHLDQFKYQKERDTIIEGIRHVKMTLTPQRPVNRIELFSDTAHTIKTIQVNGMPLKRENSAKRQRLLTYYVSDQDALVLEFEMPEGEKPSITIYEASYDLLTHHTFDIPARSDHMIPKPFVLNDAVVVRKTITMD
ncbi:M20/M25/M40 family metallo-hydrolase [Aestuariivivens sediminicola]|uniref:M20/M25/M40 family metallo-hydrolase n=1 Tax=Aestuariivivens sediminicola TaxID=2913560 RepID=UPI001F581401|nr:M20/M25/M40 family metallo-hydrolase [Aestuariivivens sediminicola]